MPAPHRLSIAREIFKFSCAHMTVFPDGTKERLHGHNYYAGIDVDVTDVSFERMIPFQPVKDALAGLCAAMRERVLLAERNPFFRVERDDAEELDFRLCGKRYVLPREDVLLLPIDNVSVEALAAHLAAQMVERVAELRAPHVVGVELGVSESPGQGARCYVIRPEPS